MNGLSWLSTRASITSRPAMTNAHGAARLRTNLSPDDPKMRALDGYIIAQRKGVALDYGKR